MPHHNRHRRATGDAAPSAAHLSRLDLERAEHRASPTDAPDPAGSLTRGAPEGFQDRHRLAGFPTGTGGSGGNGTGDGFHIAFGQLQEAQDLLRNEGPINWSDPEWLEQRAEQLRHRTAQATELERAVLEYRDALHSAGVLRRRIERHERVLRRRVEIERLRAAGTLSRQERRSANRPTRVEVDPAAWRSVKNEAIRQRETVGRYIGAVVVQFIDSSRPPSRPPNRTTERRFARLTIDDDHWFALRAVAVDEHLSTARLIGLVVEAEATRLGGQRPASTR
jgi:hypothetical protein